MIYTHEQIESVKRRILVIKAELSEMKRAYLVDGVSHERGTRATLESELNQLNITRHDQVAFLTERKALASETKSRTFLKALVDKIALAGRQDLVDAAQEEAMAAITNEGLLEAYRGKGK